MPRHATELTDTRIRKAKAQDFPLWDGKGLHLIRSASGSLLWRLKYYRPDGRENRMALGEYPAVSLKHARGLRDTARAKLADGIDPIAARLRSKADQRKATDATFQKATERWLAVNRKRWAPETFRKAQYVVDTYLAPALRGQSVTTLGTADAARVIEAIDAHSPSIAAKARQYLGGIVKQAIRDGLREDGKLLSLEKTVTTSGRGSIPAATQPQEAKALIKAIDAYPIPVTRTALTLAMLTAMRPGIIASARWQEIDFDNAEWAVPGERMKMRHAHIVPLPRQAIALLREMEIYSAGREYVFPPLARQTTPHLHRDALSAALRRMGFQGRHATHGFRAMLRTMARERLSVDMDVLEAQLAHAKRGEVQKAYDRTTFDDERRRVMQTWADYLDNLRNEGNVVPLRRKPA
ncbi:MAG TPA: integrase arm-type DNA-binding domain-containing protein [Rhodanobacteraceae bacterium]